MSTKLFYLVLNIVDLAIFIVVANPLSMLIINLISPRYAAEITSEPKLFGDNCRGFYTRLALKWPFKWAKWWIPTERLKEYTIEQQKIYFKEVSHRPEVLWALSPEAWADLMESGSYIYTLNYMGEYLQKRDDLFAALLDLACKNQKSEGLIKQYMNCGTLPKTQMAILVEKVCSDPAGVLSRMLREYVYRCGISNEMLESIRQKETMPVLSKVIAKNNISYNQRCAVKRLYNLKNDKERYEWIDLISGKLCTDAQREMSFKQYRIFHDKGFCLSPKAIAHMLWRGDLNLARMIFRYEPQFGVQSDLIKFVLDKRDDLESILQEVISDTSHAIGGYIKSGKELTDWELGKLFDCPECERMASEYAKKLCIPEKWRGKFIALPNGEELLRYNAEKYPEAYSESE